MRGFRNTAMMLILGGAVLINSSAAAEKSNKKAGPSKAYTTLDRTIVPDPVPPGTAPSITDPASFEAKGYGKWHFGPGLPYEKRNDLMPMGYKTAAENKKTDLLRFFTITDIHITDKESPAQAIFFRKMLGNYSVSVYSPLMLYTTHMLNATIGTINELHKKKKIDFGLALGDMANNSQYNELRWFIDILDGKNINPDSGDDDDPIPGPGNDYQDPFKAIGLNKSIPWYATMGNHDHFWIGSKVVNDRLRKALVGPNILQAGNILKDPKPFDLTTYSCGTLDGSTLYGTIIGEGVVAEMKSFPTVPADANRRSLTKDEIMKEFSKSTTKPLGHGFLQNNPKNSFGACYSFEPKSKLPLKVIVLDNTQDESDTSRIYGHGSLKQGRHDWLIKQLQAGQDEGKLMIIAAHIPIGVAFGEEEGWYDEKVERAQIEELKKYPNLILWVAGHRHYNTVKAFPSDDKNHPENGFWQVETKSLREFPEQFRTFDIALNTDNTLSIFATNVDPITEVGSFAYTARSYALASMQIFNQLTPPASSGPVSYNAELIVPLSPEMQAKMAKYAKTIKKK